MGYFDRAPKSERLAIAPLPERLVRLDNELESGSKDIDFVYAVRKNELGDDYRIRVAVTHVGRSAQKDFGFQFMATAFVGGKRHRAYGHKPSHAYVKAVEQLRWTTTRLTWERNTERSVTV